MRARVRACACVCLCVLYKCIFVTIGELCKARRAPGRRDAIQILIIIIIIIIQHMSTRLINGKLRNDMIQELDDCLSESRMESVGTSATDTEIMATATTNLLGLDIVVYCRSDQEVRWMRYLQASL